MGTTYAAYEDSLDDGADQVGLLNPGSGPGVLQVAELSRLVRQMVEGTFSRVLVEGELSEWRCHGPSGHWYGKLKDPASASPALIDVVMWKSAAARMGRVPPSGSLVRATGKLTTYAGKSTYQLSIDGLQEAGLGALMQRLEALKRKLTEEGLFDPARKKPLPYLPRLIGIITAEGGAVIHDMLNRLEARCPRDVALWPVAVQGPTAAAEVVRALEGFNRLDGEVRPDVVIVARGGGSVEDLMPFNDEALVRAVAASGIPVISAIGHEPDFTLCDFAADYRAPTPTAAAERVVPVRQEELARLMGAQQVLERSLLRGVEIGQSKLAYLRRLLPDPMRLLAPARQRLDEVSAGLPESGVRAVASAKERLAGLERVLLALNPEEPLARGFALVTARDGSLVTSAGTSARDVILRFGDGVREAVLQ